MNKKGLSTVVTTLIIILLVFVAIGIVWVVVKNIITNSAEQISLGGLTINLEIKDVKINLDTIEINVKRNPGEGELSGIKFLVSDGVGTQVFEEETNMQELGERRFTLNYAGLVKEVSIAPILKSKSGKEIIGREIDKKVFSNKEIIKNLGAVSWWRFEGNAQDEIGGNNGVEQGGVNCNADGKYGKACSFDGVGGNIGISNSLGLGENSFTFSHWIKTMQIEGQIYTIGNTGDADGYRFGISSGTIAFLIGNDSSSTETTCGTQTVNDGNWHLITGVYNRGDAFYCYIDGVFGDSIPIPFYKDMSDSNPGIGAPPCCVDFNGTIDEPMIFNRALTAEEIKALYNLELN